MYIMCKLFILVSGVVTRSMLFILCPPDLRGGRSVLIRHLSTSLHTCAAGFALLNLPKGKSLGRSKPATNSYAQALATHCVGFLLYPSSSELPYAK
jgi:hypothetical protein